ncbi:MAG: hypothetical protein RJA70_2394, partial [Pseudomonadota bacterium]
MSTRGCPQCAFSCDAESHYCPHCGFPVGAVSMKNEDPLVGKVLPGGYQVVDLLGVGGMGRVYRAEQRALGRTVAVKVIHPHLLSDEKSLARFMTEARATSQLNHPNSVSVIDFGKTDDGHPYLVMEFLRGRNLAQVQALEGPLSIPRIIGVLQQVLLALGEAHELEMIHRDLKPENIVLEPLRRGGDFVKVVDFGLAKLKTTEAPGITMPGIVCGTPDFMAPEQGRGDPIDGRSDLYAVGVVLFWLLTGRLPFESSSPTQVVLMHISMPVPNARELAPQREIPDALLAVLNKALAKNAKDRFQDAHEFVDALQECGERRPDPAARQAQELPSEFLQCPTCQQWVPHVRYCYECGHRLPERSLPPSPAQDRLLLFLGREEDLLWLEHRWRQSSVGPCLVRIIGEPGVGKSRLVEEFRKTAEANDALFVGAGPDPYWAEVAGYTLRTLLTQLVSPEALGGRATRLSENGRAAMHQLLLSPAGGSDLNPSAALRSATLQRQGNAELLGWALDVARASRPAGVVVLLDDLDRVDGLTRQTLDDYLPLLEPGIFIIATHTPQLRVEWPHEQVRLLNGLPAHIATDLLQRSSMKQLPVILSELGNRGIPPLYIDQVLAFGFDGGSDPPARLADLIAHRLSTLEPDLRRVLQGLAVLGDDVSEALLSEMLGQRYVTPDVVERLLRTRLARRNSSERLSLIHPLLHDLVRLATPAEVRRDLHAKAAQAFQQHDAPLEVLAEHAVLAQDSMTALFFLEQVANRAFSRGDDRTATSALSRGLDLAREEIYRGQLEDPMRAIAIFGRKLGTTLNRRGLHSDAEGVLLETLDSTEPASGERLDVLEQLAEAAAGRGKGAEAARYKSQALQVAQAANLHEAVTRLSAVS